MALINSDWLSGCDGWNGATEETQLQDKCDTCAFDSPFVVPFVQLCAGICVRVCQSLPGSRLATAPDHVSASAFVFTCLHMVGTWYLRKKRCTEHGSVS